MFESKIKEQGYVLFRNHIPNRSMLEDSIKYVGKQSDKNNESPLLFMFIML